VEAAVKYDDCQIKAYYLGEARHAFYSLDESGHMQVRPPMAYLNQIATSFDNLLFERLNVDVMAINNAHCNANPSKEDLDLFLALSHKSTCVWDVGDGATIPTTDEPLMEGDVEDYFTGKLAGTVGPFTELNPPINPFTITPAPTTDPATGAASSAAASGGRSETGESSSTGLLIGIGEHRGRTHYHIRFRQHTRRREIGAVQVNSLSQRCGRKMGGKRKRQPQLRRQRRPKRGRAQNVQGHVRALPGDSVHAAHGGGVTQIALNLFYLGG